MAILGNTTLITGRCYGDFITNGTQLIGTSSTLSNIPGSGSNPLQVNGYAVASGFKIPNGTADQLLCANGDSVSVDELVGDFKSTNYVAKIGDTMTGDLTMSSAAIIYSLNVSSAGSKSIIKCTDSGTNKNPNILTFINGGGNPILKVGDSNFLNIYIGNETYVTQGGAVNATLGFFQTSDIRKKTNLKDLDLDQCYELIDKCQTVLFDYKEGAKDQMGMIAQEVEEFFPEIVSTDADGFKSLDYAKLTVVILRVLKDLIKKVNGVTN